MSMAIAIDNDPPCSVAATRATAGAVREEPEVENIYH